MNGAHLFELDRFISRLEKNISYRKEQLLQTVEEDYYETAMFRAFVLLRSKRTLKVLTNIRENWSTAAINIEDLDHICKKVVDDLLSELTAELFPPEERDADMVELVGILARIDEISKKYEAGATYLEMFLRKRDLL